MTVIDHASATTLGLSEFTTAATAQSAKWYERAKRVLAGGISSSARSTVTGNLQYPLYISHGSGSHIWDADDNEFIDFLLSYGSLPVGHCHPVVTHAVRTQLDLGTMYGTCNTAEVELAEQICRMVPCAERVRFANSGSEAICGAIRAARGYTGRAKVLKFEGHYHGWVDVLAVSNRPSLDDAGDARRPHSVGHSRGIPTSVVDDVVLAQWNDRTAVMEILDHYADEFAAIILEPVVANNACTMPQPGFLEWLRETCSQRGIMLIFDEIVTGFRLAPGGAQEVFGVIPDLAVFSKAVGGGFPLSAFAGSAEIMELISQNKVKHGGTYNGNPISAVAALATLRLLDDPAHQQRLHSTGDLMIEEIRRSSRDFGISCVVQGMGSMFQVIFGLIKPSVNYRDLFKADAAKYAAFRQSLLQQGIHTNSSGLACIFTSTAHDEADAHAATDAIRVALRSLR
jgi:glutamate-1-semialdehyde 2,1-aminomutase